MVPSTTVFPPLWVPSTRADTRLDVDNISAKAVQFPYDPIDNVGVSSALI